MSKKQHLVKWIPAVLLAGTLAACGPSEPPNEPARAATVTAATATPAQLASQLKATRELTLVHAWATWCGPCRAEFPELVHVMKEFPDLKVLLVSGDEPDDAADVEAFLLEHESPVGSLITTELSEAFITTLSPNWSGAMPATFFYRDGKITREWEGPRTVEQFALAIEELSK